MSKTKESDEAVVERARKRLASRRSLRWVMFCYAIVFLGVAVHCNFKIIDRIEQSEDDQFLMGFMSGIATVIACLTYGIIGALCLGKSLAGFDRNLRTEELLVQYHDRLRDQQGVSPAAQVGPPTKPVTETKRKEG
ncbi:MAG: hypothetical protein ACLQU4_09300 [Limisphaerales bacterium]